MIVVNIVLVGKYINLSCSRTNILFLVGDNVIYVSELGLLVHGELLLFTPPPFFFLCLPVYRISAIAVHNDECRFSCHILYIREVILFIKTR